MSTAYTNCIENGNINSGNEFIMICARAFGACIEMKDEPLSTKLPEASVEDDFYQELLEDARAELEKYQTMSNEEIKTKTAEVYDKRVAEISAELEKNKVLREKYLAILSEVQSWVPPTTKHMPLKQFAIKQIQMSLPDDTYLLSELANLKQTTNEWLYNRVQCCIHNIEHYEKEISKEKERVNDKNQWISELRASLNNDK